MKDAARRPSYQPVEGKDVGLSPLPVSALVSHEMRTPLTAIIGYATTLLHHSSQLTSDEQQEFLHALLSAGKCLEQVVNLLLELIQLPRLTERISANLMHLVQEATMALRPKSPTPLQGKSG